jgi:hypothetical protein
MCALDRALDSLSGAPSCAPPLFSRDLVFRDFNERGHRTCCPVHHPKILEREENMKIACLGPPDKLYGAPLGAKLAVRI